MFSSFVLSQMRKQKLPMYFACVFLQEESYVYPPPNNMYGGYSQL